MEGSKNKFMKVGLVHFMAYPNTLKGEGPIVETLTKVARDDYFDAIEITWIKDSTQREEAKKLLKASGLSISYAAQPAVLLTPLNPNSLDQTEREKALQILKQELESAYEFGASGFALLSGRDPGEEKRAEAKSALIETLKELCQYAKEKGKLKVVLETFDRAIDKKALIGPSIEAQEIAQAVRKEYDNFGIMLDLSHLPLLNETPQEAISALSEYLVHIHIGNCILKDKNHPAWGDTHPRFGLEGGENDVQELREFLRVLLDKGILNETSPPVVSFEVKPLPGEDSEVIIANAKRTLDRAWRLI
jgi:sugar phosphate isomerase/epimerase